MQLPCGCDPSFEDCLCSYCDYCEAYDFDGSLDGWDSDEED